MKKRKKYNEHLDHILKKTTPYQRMLWLKRALEFWKKMQILHSQDKRRKTIKT